MFVTGVPPVEVQPEIIKLSDLKCFGMADPGVGNFAYVSSITVIK
jgi:hypothetical protein